MDITMHGKGALHRFMLPKKQTPGVFTSGVRGRAVPSVTRREYARQSDAVVDAQIGISDLDRHAAAGIVTNRDGCRVHGDIRGGVAVLVLARIVGQDVTVRAGLVAVRAGGMFHYQRLMGVQFGGGEKLLQTDPELLPRRKQ